MFHKTTNEEGDNRPKACLRSLMAVCWSGEFPLSHIPHLKIRVWQGKTRSFLGAELLLPQKHEFTESCSAASTGRWRSPAGPCKEAPWPHLGVRPMTSSDTSYTCLRVKGRWGNMTETWVRVSTARSATTSPPLSVKWRKTRKFHDLLVQHLL